MTQRSSASRTERKASGRDVQPERGVAMTSLRYDLEQASPEELARQAQAGSLPSFTQLVGIFEARLFNFLLRRTGNRDDAEELVQETFVRAWERIDRYDDRWRFSTWLFTIGSRLAVSHHRAKKRTLVTDALSFHADGAPGPDDEAARRESRAPTWELAARILSEAQHTALWLRYAEGLSMAEIAQVMGKSQVSVRVTLFRARDQLATHIRMLAAKQKKAANSFEPMKQIGSSSEQSDREGMLDPGILAFLEAT